MWLFGNHWQLGRGIETRKGKSFPAWVLLRFNREGKVVSIGYTRDYPPAAIWFMVALGFIRVIPNELDSQGCSSTARRVEADLYKRLAESICYGKCGDPACEEAINHV